MLVIQACNLTEFHLHHEDVRFNVDSSLTRLLVAYIYYLGSPFPTSDTRLDRCNEEHYCQRSEVSVATFTSLENPLKSINAE
jgi:hypothetical protein